MGRTVREAALASRTARLRLAVSNKPYWRALEQGLHFGYRRRATGGSWIARRRNDEGIYREAKLGLADDLQDANGETILDFSQAQRAARTWCANTQRLDSGFATVSTGPYTVARAIADYLEDYRRRSGKATEGIESVVRRNVLPELGLLQVTKLTTRRLLDWHRGIAERPRHWRSRSGAKPNLGPFDRKDAEAVRRRRASAKHEIAEAASAGIEQSRDLVVGQIADDRRFDRPERLHPAPSIIRWHDASPPCMIERCL